MARMVFQDFEPGAQKGTECHRGVNRAVANSVDGVKSLGVTHSLSGLFIATYVPTV